MFKRSKRDDGFTLVELIVVIVILSILIGVTIGGISSWIKKARLNTDLNNANTIQTMVSTKLGTSSWNLAFNKAAR